METITFQCECLNWCWFILIWVITHRIACGNVLIFKCSPSYRHFRSGAPPVINPIDTEFPNETVYSPAHNLTLSIQSGQNTTIFNVTNPVSGDWFVAAHLPEDDGKIEHKVARQMPMTCGTFSVQTWMLVAECHFNSCRVSRLHAPTTFSLRCLWGGWSTFPSLTPVCVFVRQCLPLKDPLLLSRNLGRRNILFF